MKKIIIILAVIITAMTGCEKPIIKPQQQEEQLKEFFLKNASLELQYWNHNGTVLITKDTVITSDVWGAMTLIYKQKSLYKKGVCANNTCGLFAELDIGNTTQKLLISRYLPYKESDYPLEWKYGEYYLTKYDSGKDFVIRYKVRGIEVYRKTYHIKLVLSD